MYLSIYNVQESSWLVRPEALLPLTLNDQEALKKLRVIPICLQIIVCWIFHFGYSIFFSDIPWSLAEYQILKLF